MDKQIWLVTPGLKRISFPLNVMASSKNLRNTDPIYKAIQDIICNDKNFYLPPSEKRTFKTSPPTSDCSRYQRQNEHEICLL